MSELYVAGICGHFGFGKDFFDGQTVKTKIVSDELEKQLGSDCIYKVDTYGGMKRFGFIAVQYLKMFMKCKNIMILPAQNGLKLFVPLAVLLNIFFHRKLHYIVIGGWLAEYLKKNTFLIKCLKKFDNIYVETNTMKSALEKMGFKNIVLMPNCKELNILDETNLRYNIAEPLKLCTFSRVTKMKGIEDAIYAVKEINEYYGRTVYSLDIYGQVDPGQQLWFEGIQKKFPDYVKYTGIVPYDQSVETLKNYFALLFPTHYYTEGIPGTIIDAYSAGVPVIASRWENFADMIDENVTGIGYVFSKQEALKALLSELAEEPEKISKMKKACICKAEEFLPCNTVCVLIEKLI